MRQNAMDLARNFAWDAKSIEATQRCDRQDWETQLSQRELVTLSARLEKWREVRVWWEEEALQAVSPPELEQQGEQSLAFHSLPGEREEPKQRVLGVEQDFLRIGSLQNAIAALLLGRHFLLSSY